MAAMSPVVGLGEPGPTIMPLTAEKPGLYALPGVFTENDDARDVTLHLVPFAAAREYRIWLPVPAAVQIGRAHV